MQFVLIIIAVLFGLWIAAWLVMAGAMWLLLPLITVMLPLCVLAGIGLGLCIPVLVLVGQQDWRPVLITADDMRHGRGNLAKRRRATPFNRDPAWPSYLVGQSRIDLRAIWNRTISLLTDGWESISELPDTWGADWTWVLVIIFLYPGWLLVNIGAVLATGAVLAIASTVLFVVWLCWLLVAGALRGADAVVRRLRGAAGSCPSCYHVSTLPAFPCPKCAEMHRDIRPGRLGAVWRRCVCGTLLPTTVLRAAHRMPAHCPSCLGPLRPGAAVQRDVRIAVFGPVSAGKTRLVYAGLMAMSEQAAATGGLVDFVDDNSKNAFDNGVRIITEGGDTAKTPAGQLPTAITARIALPKRTALLHLFDAAGEFYIDRGDNSELQFLDFAQGFVFVIDPFSVPWVQDQLGGLASVLLADANAAVDDPQGVYHITAGRLRDYHVDLKARQLAIAVVKSDLLGGHSAAEDLRPDTVKDWLGMAGLDNLVLAAERDFGEVRYFMVASVNGIRPDSPQSPIHPFGWLLSGVGVPLLPEEQAVPKGAA